jgi:hypothetical protein
VARHDAAPKFPANREFAALAGSRQGSRPRVCARNGKDQDKAIEILRFRFPDAAKTSGMQRKAATAELGEGIQHCHSMMGVRMICSLFVLIQECAIKTAAVGEITD